MRKNCHSIFGEFESLDMSLKRGEIKDNAAAVLMPTHQFFILREFF